MMMMMMTKSPATAAATQSPNCSKINPKKLFFFSKHSHSHLSLNYHHHRPNNNNNNKSSFSISQIKIPKETSLSGSSIEEQWITQEGFPPPQTPPAVRLSDKAFFLFAFIACTTSVAFTSFVIAAVPTLHAMGRAAISFSKLADTAREELPSTMAAIRLSGMEISDLTLELSDLSQEIAEGVNKSAQAVQAAEAGIRQMGSRAREQTMSMIEERANLPNLSLQPVVVGAAKKTSRAVGQATKTLMNMISRGDGSSDDENDNANAIERLEI